MRKEGEERWGGGSKRKEREVCEERNVGEK